ncbi:hypothetical protein HAX54_034055 [Datura stramonium]|uniref:Dehydrogenase/reductase SDR family member 12 n=1 Tax=Datura stramonium TaxID=4076 RepID=A0ABS8SDX9_DATST|nr:hypothetical protein [Datura stramonium]
MICRNKERGEASLTKIHSVTGNKNVYLEVSDISSVNDVKSFPSRYELSLATNVLGTYTLTELMLPLPEKAAPDARVITVSSGGIYRYLLTTDLHFSGDTFDGVLQCGRNKRVQVAMTEKWAEMYEDKGVGFYSMHPGLAKTPGMAKRSFEGKLRSSEEGADTVIWLALQPKEKLVSGAFYFDRAEEPKHLAIVRHQEVSFCYRLHNCET